MRSPRLRAVLAAVHWGRCTRFALPHASSITRRSPGVVARILPMFESKVLRRSAANYALMLRSCNGSRQHFLDCCVHATSIEAIDGFRRRNRCGFLRLSSSTTIEEPARRTLCSMACLRRGARRVRPSSRPCAATLPTLCGASIHALRFPSYRFRCHTPRRRGIQYAAASRFNHCCLWNTGSPAFAGDDGLVGIVAARPPEAGVVGPVAPAGRVRLPRCKLSINAENPGTETTTR
jgi:hypothetical protein